MIFVSSPYTSEIEGAEELRYRQVRDFVDRMMAKGFVAFSPIVYCHPIAKRIGHGTDANTWLRFNMSILRRSEAMYLLCLPGWENSKGVKLELNVCKMLDIPVAKYSPTHKLLSEEWKGHLVEQF